MLNAYNRGNQHYDPNPGTINSAEGFPDLEHVTSNSTYNSEINHGVGSGRNGINFPAGEDLGNPRKSRTFKLAMPSTHRSMALIRKNFMQTFRNIG